MKKKEKKDIRKKLIIALIVLLVLDVLFIPLLYIAEIKKTLPIMVFIAIPLVLGIIVFLLSRACFNSYESKKEKILERIN